MTARKYVVQILKGAYKSYFVFSTGATIIAIAGAWWWRPIPEKITTTSTTSTAAATAAVGVKDSHRRDGFMSKTSYTDHANKPKPFELELATSFTISFTVLLSRLFLFYGGHTEIKHDDNYSSFLKIITKSMFEKEKPLLTISNHRSLLDDPLILSSLLPFQMNVQPKYCRYALCSQEYCFNEMLPSLIHAYMGAGQVLPIHRGGGINQKSLLNFARLLAAGKWCHLMPEGGIWQTNTLGSWRKIEEQHQKGKLKWGIGKLIAHAPIQPHVIPFFFLGTENIYPQHPESKAISNTLPRTGHRVEVIFGKELFFDDLIEEHEKKYGPLWKYYASIDEEYENGLDSDDFHSHWDSKPEDYELYSMITMRIQKALEELNDTAISNQKGFSSRG